MLMSHENFAPRVLCTDFQYFTVARGHLLNLLNSRSRSSSVNIKGVLEKVGCSIENTKVKPTMKDLIVKYHHVQTVSRSSSPHR